MHCRSGTMPERRPWSGVSREQPIHDKKRVPVPDYAGAPYALANETGCPEGICRPPDGGGLSSRGVLRARCGRILLDLLRVKHIQRRYRFVAELH